MVDLSPMALQNASTMKRLYQQLLEWMYRPVDAASMTVFRIGFGAIMVWEVHRYFDHNWIAKYYTGKPIYFTYPGFSWVKPWPSLELMEAHFIVMALLAFMVMIGFMYRFAAPALAVVFTYIYLLEQARYLNHFYFVILVAITMIFVPAHRYFSVDAWLKKRWNPWPFLDDARKNFMDNWAVWAVKMQFGITYLYGGIAKLNADWLNGYPLSDWIVDDSHLPVVGPYVHERWMGLLLSYSGLLLDLAFVPLLLWKKTRWLGLVCAVAFNLMNDQLFSIGIFPWMMMVGTTLFIEPDWPKRLWDFCTLGPKGRKEMQSNRMANLKAIPALLFRITTRKKLLAGFMVAFFAYQFLFPFRHFLYPGSVHWTEEGHKYAWHMKLRSKRGSIMFIVKHPASGREFTVDPDDYLNSRQLRKMSARPTMILQFAHWLRDRFEAEGLQGIEIYAESFASLNGRAQQRLIDNTVNLAAIEWSILPNHMHEGANGKPWIVPLHTERKR